MSKQTEATLTINDMACNGCANTVQNALNEVKGVQEASADHEKGIAAVSYNDKEVATNDLKQAVENAGYTVKGIE